MPTVAKNPIPEGMHSITPHLWFNGNCKAAIDFYANILGAKLCGPISFDPEGIRVYHALLKIGDSPFMMADSWPGTAEKGPEGFANVGIWLYVEDCDLTFNKAFDAGCEVIMPLMDSFWGDRLGKIRDPFGHVWAIATHKFIVTEEEQEQALKDLENPNHHGDCCC